MLKANQIIMPKREQEIGMVRVKDKKMKRCYQVRRDNKMMTTFKESESRTK